MSREEQFDFYWKEIFDGLPYNPIEFNVYRFDQSMSLPSKFNKLYEMFKQLALNNQEVMDYLKEFVETFDFKLETTIKDILVIWLNEGLLAEVVREAINDEVTEARTDYLGLTYLNLKERLDLERKEVVMARGDEQTLNERLNKDKNEVDTHLTQTMEDLEERGVNVKSFGAKGDGITDDTLAIQNAIDSSYKIIIPEGVYLISSTLRITKIGQKIEGKGYYNTILKPTINFSGDSIVLIDGGLTPAFRSNQRFSGIGVEGRTLVDCLRINKNADFVISECRFYNGNNGLHLKDVLLYTINNCRFDKNDVAIYFYGKETLSPSNSSDFIKNVIIENRVAIKQRQGSYIGGCLVFEKCEIEANGVVEGVEPTISITGDDSTKNIITFRDCWFESNRNKISIKLVMGLRNTALFDNCRMINTPEECDYMILAEPLSTTYNGDGASIEIVNSYDPSIYNIHTLKTTGKIVVQTLGFYYQSISVENIDNSFVRRASFNEFVSNMNFGEGKGINLRSQGGSGSNKVYSKSNGLFIESELGYIEMSSPSGKYWGSSLATDYTRPFRIGHLWLWQNGGSLYMKRGVAPTTATDGVILGTST